MRNRSPMIRPLVLLVALLVGCGSSLRPATSASLPATPDQASPLHAVAAPPPPGGFAALPPGTAVVITPAETISSADGSRRTRTSLETSFVVSRDVLGPDGQVTLPRGTPVEVAVRRERRKVFGRSGSLEVTARSLRPAGAAPVSIISQPLRFEGDERVGGTLVGSAFLGPLFLLRRGGDVALLPGAELVVVVGQAS